VPKNILAFELLHLLPLITNEPGHECNVALLYNVVVDDVDVVKHIAKRKTVDLALFAVEQVVVADKHVYVFKRPTQAGEVTGCVVECGHVNASAMVMPVTQEDAGFTAMCSGFCNEPNEEFLTVNVVLATVVLVAKVDVSETRGVFK